MAKMKREDRFAGVVADAKVSKADLGVAIKVLLKCKNAAKKKRDKNLFNSIAYAMNESKYL